MADYSHRSKSYSGGQSQIEPYGRSQSVSYTSSSNYSAAAPPPPEKLKKGKSTNGSTSRTWGFTDPELQRKKRVASYKVYSVEGKVKGSFRKSFRWLKNRYTQMANGW
ncbi:hypothetical protein OROMI_031081 [Orobanche minor]